MGDLVQFRPLKAPVQSGRAHNEMILDRVRGIPANVEIAGAIVDGDPNIYNAPERDPA